MTKARLLMEAQRVRAMAHLRGYRLGQAVSREKSNTYVDNRRVALYRLILPDGNPWTVKVATPCSSDTGMRITAFDLTTIEGHLKN